MCTSPTTTAACRWREPPVYVKVSGPLNFPAYLDGLRNGRSFVSTCRPRVHRRRPRAWRCRPGRSQHRSALGNDRQLTGAIRESGRDGERRVVWSGDGLDGAGQKKYSGRVNVPVGGWIAARALALSARNRLAGDGQLPLRAHRSRSGEQRRQQRGGGPPGGEGSSPLDGRRRQAAGGRLRRRAVPDPQGSFCKARKKLEEWAK